MTKVQLAALLALSASLGAGAAGLSTAALVRETAGTKTYYARSLRFVEEPGNPDGGNVITAINQSTVTLGLADGGTSVIDLGDAPCNLTAAQENQAQNLLTASATCARNAP